MTDYVPRIVGVGMRTEPTSEITAILEALRTEIRNATISYGEISELESLAEYIEEGDVELLEWAGVPEFPTEDDDDQEVSE